MKFKDIIPGIKFRMPSTIPAERGNERVFIKIHPVMPLADYMKVFESFQRGKDPYYEQDLNYFKHQMERPIKAIEVDSGKQVFLSDDIEVEKVL